MIDEGLIHPHPDPNFAIVSHQTSDDTTSQHFLLYFISSITPELFFSVLCALFLTVNVFLVPITGFEYFSASALLFIFVHTIRVVVSLIAHILHISEVRPSIGNIVGFSANLCLAFTTLAAFQYLFSNNHISATSSRNPPNGGNTSSSDYPFSAHFSFIYLHILAYTTITTILVQFLLIIVAFILFICVQDDLGGGDDSDILAISTTSRRSTGTHRQNQQQQQQQHQHQHISRGVPPGQTALRTGQEINQLWPSYRWWGDDVDAETIARYEHERHCRLAVEQQQAALVQQQQDILIEKRARRERRKARKAQKEADKAARRSSRRRRRSPVVYSGWISWFRSLLPNSSADSSSSHPNPSTIQIGESLTSNNNNNDNSDSNNVNNNDSLASLSSRSDIFSTENDHSIQHQDINTTLLNDEHTKTTSLSTEQAQGHSDVESDDNQIILIRHNTLTRSSIPHTYNQQNESPSMVASLISEPERSSTSDFVLEDDDENKDIATLSSIYPHKHDNTTNSQQNDSSSSVGIFKSMSQRLQQIRLSDVSTYEPFTQEDDTEQSPQQHHQLQQPQEQEQQPQQNTTSLPTLFSSNSTYRPADQRKYYKSHALPSLSESQPNEPLPEDGLLREPDPVTTSVTSPTISPTNNSSDLSILRRDWINSLRQTRLKFRFSSTRDDSGTTTPVTTTSSCTDYTDDDDISKVDVHHNTHHSEDHENQNSSSGNAMLPNAQLSHSIASHPSSPQTSPSHQHSQLQSTSETLPPVLSPSPSLPHSLHPDISRVPSAISSAQADNPSVDATPTSYHHAQCNICLDDFELGSSLKSLPCGHRFHGACLRPWLKMHNECPVCRSHLFPEILRTEHRRQNTLRLLQIITNIASIVGRSGL